MSALSFKGESKWPVMSRLIWRERFLIAMLLMCLVMLVILAYASFFSASDNQITQKEVLYRTEGELIGTAKRFVSCLYGLDSSNVREKQYCAVDLMLDEASKQKRLDYLLEKDFIRLVERSDSTSSMAWDQSKIIMTEKDNGTFEIDIAAALKIDRQTHNLHLAVTVGLVERSDVFSDGVGILSWRDYATNPLDNKNHE